MFCSKIFVSLSHTHLVLSEQVEQATLPTLITRWQQNIRQPVSLKTELQLIKQTIMNLFILPICT